MQGRSVEDISYCKCCHLKQSRLFFFSGGIRSGNEEGMGEGGGGEKRGGGEGGRGVGLELRGRCLVHSGINKGLLPPPGPVQQYTCREGGGRETCCRYGSLILDSFLEASAFSFYLNGCVFPGKQYEKCNMRIRHCGERVCLIKKSCNKLL